MFSAANACSVPAIFFPQSVRMRTRGQRTISSLHLQAAAGDGGDVVSPQHARVCSVGTPATDKD